MLTTVHDWLLGQGFADRTAGILTLFAEIALVLTLAYIVHFIGKLVVSRVVRRFAEKSKTRWDDLLVKREVFVRAAHLAPAVVIYHFAPIVLAEYGVVDDAVRQLAMIYMVFVVASVFDRALNAVVDGAPVGRSGRPLPVKTFVQVAKIIVYGIVAVSVISLVLGKSPLLLLGGLGAMTAIVMLVFQDAILGFVAGIQLSANDMVATGDWIEMPKYGADGEVMEVALTTVKVQNWDKTITTIPTYALIKESFKNWRGMSESGGRRIKRAIHINMNSIKFCDHEMLRRFSQIEYMTEYLDRKRAEIEASNDAADGQPSAAGNQRRLTNIGTFRAYVVAYLRHNPNIHQEMTFIVRQLAPTQHGLPLEIYVFSKDQRWANYEAIQADIFDHLLSIVPKFDLQVFQSEAGTDVRRAQVEITRDETARG